MPETGVKIKTKWIDKDGFLKAIKKALRIPSERVMRALSVRLAAMQRQHFEKGVDSRGKKWKKLKESTIARRRKGSMTPGIAAALGIGISLEPKPLLDTGALRASISPAHTSRRAIAGTNKKYAATHQWGREEANIPAREFIYINKEEGQELTDFIARELIGKPLLGQR